MCTNLERCPWYIVSELKMYRVCTIFILEKDVQSLYHFHFRKRKNLSASLCLSQSLSLTHRHVHSCNVDINLYDLRVKNLHAHTPLVVGGMSAKGCAGC